MPATFTTRLGLRKPDPDPVTGDNVNVQTDINDSMDKLDAAVGFFVCTSGTRPVGADRWDGRQIYETDTRRTYMWAAALTTWLPLLSGRGTAGPYQLGTSTDASGEGVNGAGTVAGADMWRTRITGDAEPRFVMEADGNHLWGSGAAVPDVNLYRSAVGTIKTDQNFTVAGNLTVGSYSSGVPIKFYDNVMGVATASIGPIAVPTTGFRSLRLEIVGRSNVAAIVTSLRIRFNGDASAIYHSQSDYGQTNTSGAAEVVNGTAADITELVGSTAPANMPGSMSIFIPWYRGTTFFKQLTYLSTSQITTGAAGCVCRNGCAAWRSTSAINDLTIFPASGSFIAGSSIAMYALP